MNSHILIISLRKTVGDFPTTIGRVVKELAWREQGHRFLPPPVTVSWQASFTFRDAPGTLSVNISPARQAKVLGRLLVLEMSARGLPVEAPPNHMEDWFSHAHEWIVCGFEDLTSDEAQKRAVGQTCARWVGFREYH